MSKKREVPGYALIMCFTIVCSFFFLTACGGKKETKAVSSESNVSLEAFAVAETVRSAYVRKDFAALANACTNEGYREVLSAVKHFDSVDLSFTPKWVEVDKSKVYLNIAWKGTWVVGKETVNERGMAVFLFEGSPLKLSKIVKGNPFKYPERP